MRHETAMTDSRVVLLMGATATGKTQLAFDLVDSGTIPVQIINVDSVQFYRGFNIGSAKPDARHIASYGLRMIDICNPDEIYTVARFCREIEYEISNARQQGKIPLLTGGTMMYFRALTQGLSAMPDADQEMRKTLLQQQQRHGTPWLHSQLEQVDPVTAERLSKTDSQRIIRAIEVFRLSGKPISQWHQQTSGSRHQFLSLVVSRYSRAQLHRRIKERFEGMIDAGLVDEVRELQKQWHQHTDKPVFRSIGYKQVLEHLQGKYDHQTMLEKGVIATRQLAKRQITWLRSWSDAHYLNDGNNSDNNKKLVQQMATIIDRFVAPARIKTIK